MANSVVGASYPSRPIIYLRTPAVYAYAESKSTRAPKPAGTTNTLLQLLDLLDLGGDDSLQHQLGNPVALLHLVVRVGMVEEQDLDLSAVISVDDARAGVDEVLGGEARSGGNSAVYPKERCQSAENSASRVSGLRGRTYTFQRGQTC